MNQINENIEDKKLEILSLEITTRCNLECNNCFARAALPEKGDMDWEMACAILKEGFEAGFRIFHLTGGEPFLYKDLCKLLDYAFELGYETGYINTNATLLNNGKYEKLSAYTGRLNLTCSINGYKELHESVRGIGNYGKTCKGIDYALESGLDVDIYTTVGKDLLPRLPAFVESTFNKFPRIKSIFFIQLHRVKDDFYNLKDKMLSPLEFISLVRTAGFLRLKDYPLYFLENPLVNVVAKTFGMKWLPVSPDYHRYGKMMVLQDGRITGDHSSRNGYGYFTPGGVRKALESSLHLEEIAPDKEICPACKFREICSENGMIRPVSQYYNDLEESFFCKRVIEEIIGI